MLMVLVYEGRGEDDRLVLGAGEGLTTEAQGTQGEEEGEFEI